jgi:hypothetical protein
LLRELNVIVCVSLLITIEKELVVANAPLASVKRTVIEKFPEVVGVPEISPVLVFSDTPAGSEPEGRE